MILPNSAKPLMVAKTKATVPISQMVATVSINTVVTVATAPMPAYFTAATTMVTGVMLEPSHLTAIRAVSDATMAIDAVVMPRNRALVTSTGHHLYFF